MHYVFCFEEAILLGASKETCAPSMISIFPFNIGLQSHLITSYLRDIKYYFHNKMLGLATKAHYANVAFLINNGTKYYD